MKPAPLFDQAVAHHQSGRPDLAEPLYRRVLATTPRHADAARLLGLLLHQSGRGAAAVALLEEAAARTPRDAALRDVLGVALKGLGRLDDAVAAFRAAVALDANAFGPAYNLGNALRAAGRDAEAEAAYRAAVRLDPANPWGWNNLADTRRALGQYEAAAEAARAAVLLAPDAPEFRHNLAAAQALQAEALTRQALAHQHDGDFAAARALFAQAARLCPHAAMAHNNLGDVLRHLGALDESEAAFRTALRLDPGLACARYGLALTLLGAGRFAEGWDAYEARWAALGWTCRFPGTPWDGTPAPGRVLLVHAEQGFGDMIQMARYLPLAAQRARVVLEAPAPLVRLFAALPGVEQVVALGEDLPAFDLHCPAMSLPRAFATTPQSIPAAVPYLRADPDAVAAWRARLDGLPGRRVGLAWASGRRFAQAHLKTLPAEALAPLAGAAGVSFVSLQKDDAGMPPFAVHDWTAELADFADTAALIAALDLVISVDTAVAHLAGALGRPVWLLVPYAADWRWRGGLGAEWYPGLRPFRQPAPGAWDAVLAAVRAALDAGTQS